MKTLQVSKRRAWLCLNHLPERWECVSVEDAVKMMRGSGEVAPLAIMLEVPGLADPSRSRFTWATATKEGWEHRAKEAAQKAEDALDGLS